MIPRNFVSIFILGLVLFPSGEPPRAQTNQQQELGVQAGYLLIEGDSGIKDDLIYGGRMGRRLSPQWSFHVSILAGKADIEGTNQSADIFLPLLVAEYDLSEGVLSPFLAVGAGLMDINRARPQSSRQTGFAGQWGGGLKWYFHSSLVGRLETHHLINAGSGSGTHNQLVTVGISWLYGEQMFRDEKRVPRIVPTADADADGVRDGLDLCADTPLGVPVDRQGCPLDSDADGVLDTKDACPATPMGWKVDEKGCSIDTDRDGVNDHFDECEGTPLGVKVGPSGCPLEAKQVPEEEWVLQGVQFEKSSAQLDPKSLTSLDEAVEILRTYTRVIVEIQGHTDSLGADAYNQTLSDRRAESVKQYLISKGIPSERLVAKGYGESKPKADNQTPLGRAANRRIEFKVLSR